MIKSREHQISLSEMERFTDEFPEHKDGKVPGAYIIEHSSGKFYVGSSGNLSQRKLRHTSSLSLGKHPNAALQKAYDENPSVVFVAIPTTTKEDAINYEQSLLDVYLKTNSLFNSSPNASVAFKGMRHSDETKEKISKINSGRVQSNETKIKNSLANMGRVFSDETKEKISKSKMGWKPPEKILLILAAANAERAIAVSINDVTYNSVSIAAKTFGVDNRTVDNRCKSTTGRFDNWKYKD